MTLSVHTLIRWLGCALGAASALLSSGPVWLALSLAGPSMPGLWSAVAISSVLRLSFRFCLLLSNALADGKLEAKEAFGVLAAFIAKCVVTTNAIMPQPMFVTVVGGAFSSGDAARAAHM